MSETIAIMFIFFVLIALGIVFYYKFSQVQMKQERAELLQKKATDTMLKALFMPELVCSKGEAESIPSCIDLLKLKSINEITRKYDQEYFEMFSYATITVQELYPGGGNWTLYAKEKVKKLDDGTIVPNWENKKAAFIPISLRDEIEGEGQDHFGYGYLQVEVYS